MSNMIMGKSCAKPVRGTRETRGTTIHNVHHGVWEQKSGSRLSPAEHATFTRLCTQIVHSLVDKITEAKRDLSPTSTPPTITTTT